MNSKLWMLLVQGTELAVFAAGAAAVAVGATHLL
jgi:hypothetical protein